MKKIVATFFGAGLFPAMPGTFASAVAVPIALILHALGGFPVLVAATLGLFALGLWSVSEAAENDPVEFVIDEIVGQCVAIWPYSAWLWMREESLSPHHWHIVFCSLALFRLFDIWKPGPIGTIDERHDSLGIMLDDVLAGLAAAALLALALIALGMEMTHDAVEELLNACRNRSLRIATAESCTGGLVSARITCVPGSSDAFDRGFVTYSNAAKREMLGVRSETISEFGAVSENTALEMAEGALARSNADIAVSITGVAGPGASERKPEGRVCFGLSRKGAATLTETREFGLIGREQVRAESVRHALEMLGSAAVASNYLAKPRN